MPTDLIEEYASGASGLKNQGGGKYQFNWKTPTDYSGSCKNIELVFGTGGLSYVEVALAYFNFKKLAAGSRPIASGSLVTIPATPRAHRRRAVAGSFTVQTCTGQPSRARRGHEAAASAP